MRSRLARLQHFISRLEARDSKLVRARVATFIGGVAMLVLTAWGPWPRSSLTLAIALFVAFAWLARVHGRVLAQIERLRLRRGLESRRFAARDHKWDELAPLPASSDTPANDAFADLDIVGPRSLLRLVNHTFTAGGYRELLRLFSSDDVSDAEIERRQALVAELRERRLFRYGFFVETLRGPAALDDTLINALLAAPLAGTRAKAVVVSLLVIQALALAALVYFMVAGGPPLFILLYVALFAVRTLTRGQLDTLGAYGHAVMLELKLSRLGLALRRLERESKVKSPELARLLAPLRDRQGASPQLDALETTTGALAARQNFIVHIVLHILMPWDSLWTYRLERQRKTLAELLPQWMTALRSCEAFASLAEFAELPWGDPVERPLSRPHLLALGAGAALNAVELRHPLIAPERAVSNSVSLGGTERCMLITGSNMSGKSTFLRTIGVNLLLAKAGAPVFARSFEFTNVPLFTALRVSDSLDDGFSSFYAEVRRLREILVHAETKGPCLYLIDEIFRGTNNRERLQGSRAFIRHLISTPAFGLVTTHDLELAALEAAHPGRIVNCHFRESIENGKMRFSYRRESGPCPTTNALEVMRLGGLPVDP